MPTGFVSSARFLDHRTLAGHPEQPERLQWILSGLTGWPRADRLIRVTPEISDPGFPTLVHTPDYVERVRTHCERGEPVIDTMDNSICPDSYSVALLAANAMRTGVDLLLQEQVHNALILPRPPGHHAERNMALGFCLFNNVALAARYAQQQYHLQRIAIVDFDVHHGNGTQHVFEEDPGVLYVSTHQYPFFPGTGTRDERGSGAGLGTTLNYPLPAGTDDAVLLDIYRNSVSDILLKFDPELLILSAGFDAHRLDPIGGFEVTTEGFRELSRILTAVARECCPGRILSVLEGGYSEQGLRDGFLAHLEELVGETQ